MPDPTKLIIGGGEFSLVESPQGTVPADAEYDAPENSFGNIRAITFNNETELKEHFGTYKNLRVLDDAFATMLKLGYTLGMDEVTDKVLRVWYLGGPVKPVADFDAGYDAVEVVPLGSPQFLRGWGCLRIYDQMSDSVPRIVHKDFFCLVRLNSQPQLAEEYLEYEFSITVLSPRGRVQHRNSPKKLK